MLSFPRITLAIAVAITLFEFTASVALADPVVLHYAGTVGIDAVACTLSFDGSNVTGSYHILDPAPGRLRDNLLGGTLSGTHLQLTEMPPLAVNASATLQGDFDSSPTANPLAGFKGIRALVVTAGAAEPIALAARAFEPPAPATLNDAPISVTGPNDRYVVSGEYPVVTGDAGGRFDKFNVAAKALIDDQIRWFGKFETGGRFEAVEPDRTTPDTMNVHYEILEFNASLVSLRYTMFLDTGGSHPNSATVTLNYDLVHDKALSLSDLFEPSTNYLHVFAVTIINAMSHDSDADYDMLVSGANSTPAHYQNWNLTSDGLIFTFDPYAIGPYSSGIQRFRFPLTSLPTTKPIVATLVEQPQ